MILTGGLGASRRPPGFCPGWPLAFHLPAFLPSPPSAVFRGILNSPLSFFHCWDPRRPLSERLSSHHPVRAAFRPPRPVSGLYKLTNHTVSPRWLWRVTVLTLNLEVKTRPHQALRGCTPVSGTCEPRTWLPSTRLWVRCTTGTWVQCQNPARRPYEAPRGRGKHISIGPGRSMAGL